jgi:MYXO-CTERM domain-containing protein
MLMFIAALMALLSQQAQAVVVRGTGTGALVGGDLTDPENDGQPDANIGYNAVFSANDEPDFGGGEFAFNVFDNQVGGGNAKWCCGPAGGIPAGGLHVTAQLNAGARFLTGFTLTSGNDSPERDPISWKIQGSNDGISFTDIVVHNASSIWSQRDQVVQFEAGKDFATPTVAYNTYRFVTLNTTANPNGAYFQFGEIEYFGTAVAPTAATTFRNINIAGSFNADVVVNSIGGVIDSTQQGVDAGNRSYLTQTAATQIGGAAGNGLPDNGTFSFIGNTVQLGYNNNDNGNNALRLTPGQSGAVALSGGDAGQYQSLFLFAISTDGDAATQVTLNYSDGSSTVQNLNIDDWFNDDGELALGVLDLIDNLDRTNGAGNGFENNNDPAIFAYILNVDPSKTLVGAAFLNQSTGQVVDIFGLGGQQLASVIPEPASAMLGLLSIGTLALRRRRLA